MSHLYLIRGLPGSGKTTLAKAMQAAGMGWHFEADQYFTDVNGFYTYDPNRLSEAHKACFEMTVGALSIGENAIVSNTFTKVWEMRKYLELKVPRTVIHCQGDHGSIHDVPSSVLEAMKQRWEPYP